MKIVDVRHIEDCFDGSFIHEVLFDADIAPAFIRALGAEGILHYHRDFARPFFRVILKGRFTIKGVEGNRTVRVLSYDRDLEPTLGYVRHAIERSADAMSGSGRADRRKDREGTENTINQKGENHGTTACGLL